MTPSLKMIDMSGQPEIANVGDVVLLYVDEKRRYVAKLRPGGITGTERGFVKHEEIIGRPYGSSVETSRGARVLVLKPLRQDYVDFLKRATQIIYPKDAAFMVYISGIGPGSRVGEAGVGTGALTIALASIVGREGRVYGFDVSEKALETARANVEKAGFSNTVVLSLGDVRSEIKVPEALDSFFLDIPDPWNAVESVGKVLKPSGTFLAFVPTFNQIEKTSISLMETGYFCDIHAYEIMLRELEVKPGATRPKPRMIGHTGFIVFARRYLGK